MKRTLLVALAITALLFVAGCAAGPNELAGSPDEEGKVAGFWHGLWHGFIALFTFVISLFTDNVRIYDVHNSGNWYNLGFLLGIMIFFGGSGNGACRRRRRR
jgi:hypothetical protein